MNVNTQFNELNLCAYSVRTLVADAVQKANSGHPGMAIGAAATGVALFESMNINPKHPQWRGRDRFVLSAGHASMLLYALLHINGYDLSIDDIKSFRQFGSHTPGHPEREMTVGVDANTGPLGQGFAMAVGMAMAEAHDASLFNRPGYKIVNNYTFTLMGDGCMMEGATHEAASLAGTLKLNKLIAIYDSNRITIEGSTDITFTEDVKKRYEAYGFNVIDVACGEDFDALRGAIELAKKSEDKPSLIIVHTEIAFGTKKANMASAHGEPLGQENIDDMKRQMGWTLPPFTVPSEVYEHYARLQQQRDARFIEHERLMAEYRAKFPELAAQYDECFSAGGVKDAEALARTLFASTPEKKMATRAASGEILNKLYSEHGVSNLFGGSADLGSSNKCVLKGSGYVSCEDYAANNIHFGVRELAMAAACNGMMLYGGVRAFCATFMVFADYLKPALRLSALMNLPVLYILTHDSVGVGEDGPTHHPIEQLAMLRATPNVHVFRPADYKETVVGYASALSVNCPTVLALSRQDLPQYENSGVDAFKGGYVIEDSKGKPDCILIASGSEVEIMLEAGRLLKTKGVDARMVSMPCCELFDAQSEEYKESVLPSDVRARVAIEAGSSFGWARYVGLQGEVVCIDTFGKSAPAKVLFAEFGFTAEKVVAAAECTIKVCK